MRSTVLALLVCSSAASLFKPETTQDSQTVEQIYASIGDLKRADASDNDVEQASFALAKHAKDNPDGPSFIVHAKGIGPLITVILGSKTAEAKQGATIALSWIARRHPHHADVIAQHHGVFALIELMRDAVFTAPEWPLLALSAMASDRPNITWEVAQRGGIARVVQLLRDPPQKGAQNKAIGALSVFSKFNVSDIIVASGAVPPLIAAIKRGFADQVSKATMTLANLAMTSTEGADEIGKADGIPPLVTLASKGDAAIKILAAKALAWVCKGSAENRDRLRQSQGLQPLVDMLQSSPMEASTAVLALTSASIDDAENAQAIVDAGGIPNLVGVSRKGTKEDQLSAALALARLAVADKDHLAAIRAEGGISGDQAIKASHTAFSTFGLQNTTYSLVDALAYMGDVQIELQSQFDDDDGSYVKQHAAA